MLCEDSGRILVASAACEDLLGVAPGKLVGKRSWRECICPEDLPAVDAYVRRRNLSPGRSEETCPCRIRDRNRKLRPVSLYVAAIPDEQLTVVVLTRSAECASEQDPAADAAAMVEVCARLSEGDSVDALCKSAVELGAERLGFREPLILLPDENGTRLYGTWRWDEGARIARDERSFSVEVNRSSPYARVLRGKHFEVIHGEHEAAGDSRQALLPLEGSDARVFGILSVKLPADAGGAWGDFIVQSARIFGFAVGHTLEMLHAREALAESERRYRVLAESAHDIIFVINPDFTVSYINAFGARQVGRTPADVIGRKVADLFPADDVSRKISGLTGVFKGGKPVRVEDRTSFMGREVWLDTTLVPLKDARNRVTAVLGISRETTARRRMEERLTQSEERYRTTLELLGDAIHVVGADHTITMCNTSFRKLCRELGLPAGDPTGKNLFEVVPCLGERVREEYRRLFAGGDAAVTREEYVNGNRRVIVEERRIPVLSDGKVVQVVTVIRNVTAEHRVEQAAAAAERRYRDLWDNAPAAYHRLDADGRITDVNRTELELLGYSREEMVGRPIFDFIVPEQRAEARSRFAQKIATRTGDRTGHRPSERDFLRKDGSVLTLSIDDAIETAPDGSVTGVRTMMLDMTAQKRYRRQLQETVDKLRRMMENTVKSIGKIVESRDPYTAGHERRVAQLARALAQELGISEDEADGIDMAAAVHDIGKVHVPAEILSKPARLTEVEFSLIKIHSQAGHDILVSIEFPWPVAQMVLQHHERLNGSGYPKGISGEHIISGARILAVADVVEAMLSHRPYRPSLGLDKTLEELSANRGTLYDAGVVDACISLLTVKGFTFA